MSTRHFYVTTSIPYVNGAPHVGHALEFVQADVLARHRRLRGDAVRLQTGTDDNSLSNVLAAEAHGLPVAELVSRNADRFEAAYEPLDLAVDDVIRTSTDPRHRPGVERLWQACADAGDLYERDYEGLYCTSCEAFLVPDELVDGRCPEHDRPPERVAERNWFFRLSRHGEALLDLLQSGLLSVEPEQRRNEALAFVRAGLEDISVSRSRERARGWGIPVPGDPGQVVYVWFDALANYVTALGYGSDDSALARWWRGSDSRVHVIGKGILRFHAVYWPAILLSAGIETPTTVVVHGYLTADGRRLSKSSGVTVDPVELVDRFGSDAVRWWLLRDVPPGGDADYREGLLVVRANAELANGLGNLVQRTLALAARVRAAGSAPESSEQLLAALGTLSADVDAALERFDFRAATDALWRAVAEANRFVETSRPWEGRPGSGGAVALLLRVCRVLARELEPFLPSGAARVAHALSRGHAPPGGLFPRREVTK